MVLCNLYTVFLLNKGRIQMNKQNVEPKFLLDVFQCPHCKSKTRHKWYIAIESGDEKEPALEEATYFYKIRIQGGVHESWLALSGEEIKEVPEDEKYLVFAPGEWHVDMSICTICSEYLIWKDNKIVYPNCHTIEDPHEDMPGEVKKLYSEAREVVNLSPRSACALLRLAVEKLLIEGLKCPKDKSIYENIKLLNNQGKLSKPINDALHAVRLVGNAAVHPGEIKVDDKSKYAYQLFELLNYAVEELISRPARAEAFIKKIKL
ncbi:DUF4145 domain-containing protein [Bacillus tropicus]|nr:DUF4145 domain-containing protein [Bacillus tropicus]